ncbi:MAG: hypothetical protein J7639_14750 [Paenibacillaceae bacterium]|nr:hypothetical protein [Paenibacillaceae bacterium]
MRIIAIEGMNRAGKTTQARFLCETLNYGGNKAVYVHFPRYDTPIGALLKTARDHGEYLNHESLHLLFEADRLDFKDQLKRFERLGYKFVIADGWSLSNEVHAATNGVDTKWLAKVREAAPAADFTFLLDISANESFGRLPERNDLFKSNKMLLATSRSLYMKAAKLLQQEKAASTQIIDGTGKPEQITALMVDHLKLAFRTELAQPEMVDGKYVRKPRAL